MIEDVQKFLDRGIAKIIPELPDDIGQLEVLDDEEARTTDRTMLRREIRRKIERLREEEGNRVPEPKGNWPVHEHDGKMMCLVPRYRPGGQDLWHYVIGPLTDIHPMKLSAIRKRLEHVGGGFVWLLPHQVDDIVFEPAFPPQWAYGQSAGEVIGLGGADHNDSTLKENW